MLPNLHKHRNARNLIGSSRTDKIVTSVMYQLDDISPIFTFPNRSFANRMLLLELVVEVVGADCDFSTANLTVSGSSEES